MSNSKVEAVKNAIDAGAGVAVISMWVAQITPLMNFIAILLAIVWGFYRIYDMMLSIKIKKHSIKINDKINKGD